MLTEKENIAINPQDQQASHSKRLQQSCSQQYQNNEQSVIDFNADQYEQMHWIAAHIDNKYYVAHPLALDKLIKLQQQIRVQKSKFNVTTKWDNIKQIQANNCGKKHRQHKKNDQTIHSDSPNLINSMVDHDFKNHGDQALIRPDSSLSRDCKTQIDERRQLSSKIQVQKQLIVEQDRYRRKLEDLKNNKIKHNRKDETQSMRNQRMNFDHEKQKKQCDENNSHKNNSLVSHRNSSKKDRSKKQSRHSNHSKITSSHEPCNEKNKIQISQHGKKSDHIPQNHRYNNAKIQQSQNNYISFQPNQIFQSPRFDDLEAKKKSIPKKSDIQNRSNMIKSANDQISKSLHGHSKKSNISNSKMAVSQHMIDIQDKSNNTKSFVINYRKTPSQSRSKDISEANRNNEKIKNNRADLKSASSITSKLQLQKLNKNIKQMQQKLQLIQRKQIDLQNMEISRIKQLHELQESRARIKSNIAGGNKKTQTEQNQLADQNVDQAKSQKTVQKIHKTENNEDAFDHTQVHDVFQKTNRQKQQHRQQSKCSEQSQTHFNKSDLDKVSEKVQPSNNNPHLSTSINNNSNLVLPQQHSQNFNILLYTKKKLNLSSSIISYNHTEDMLKMKSKELEMLKKQEMNEQIIQLKKTIRALKLERIQHQSIIEQLESQQKQKQHEMMRVRNKSKNVEKSEQASETDYHKNREAIKQREQTARVPIQTENIKRRVQADNQQYYHEQPAQNPSRNDSHHIGNHINNNHPIQGNNKRTTIRSHIIHTNREQSLKSRHDQPENINQFVRSKMIKNDSSDLPVPKKNHKGDKHLDESRVAEKTNNHIRHKNNSSNNMQHQNQEQMDLQFQSPSLGRRGIIIRQIMDNDEQFMKNDDNQKGRKLHQHGQLEPASPTSTGKKIFELEFVKADKYQATDQVQDDIDLQIPNIKVKSFKIPDIPVAPSPEITQQQLMQLSGRICQHFGIKASENQLYMKKYRNCVIFKTADPKKTVVWHYNGKFYIGGWEQNYKGQGKKTGQGFEYVPEKYYYQGQFHQGKKNGSGSMIAMVSNSKNKSVYNGQWYQGQKHGIGVYYDAQEDTYYQGEFQNNKKEGKGIYKLSQNQFYDGIFTKSIKHGYGIEKFANGDIFKGQYKFGRFHGRGKYYWANGSSYDGHFSEGHRQGSGKWRSARKGGDVYIGEYKKDKKQGRGQYIWNNGCRYDGMFTNDLKHGQGRVQYPDGRQIKGYWQNGKLIEIDQKIVQNQDSSNHSQQPLKKHKFNQIFQTPSKQLRYSRNMHRV